MWDLSQKDGPTINVLMHIIIYSILYEKKRICNRVGSAGLYIYFAIRATIKLLEKKGALHPYSLLPDTSFLYHIIQPCNSIGLRPT